MIFKEFVIIGILLCVLGRVYSDGAAGDKGVKDEPFGYHSKINVLLLGLNRDGNFNFGLDSERFRQLLQETYSIHRPSSIERSIYREDDSNQATRGKDYKPLLIHNDIQYNVQHLPYDSLALLEAAIQYNLRINDNKNLKNYNLSVEVLESYFSTLFRDMRIDSSDFTVIFVNPSLDKIFNLQDHVRDVGYQYVIGDQISGSTWISRNRFIVVDLTARPLEYGSTVHKSEGAVSLNSLPRLIEYFLPKDQQGTTLQGETETELIAHMSSLVIQTVQNVFYFDSKYDYIPIFQKVMIPVLIFSDHLAFSVKDTLNFDQIKREASRLFPFSEVSVVIGEHSIHDHKHISLALSKSIRSHTTFERNPSSDRFEASTRDYIDSKELLSLLKTEKDVLASGLIGEKIGATPAELMSSKTLQKTKILPVYVFSVGTRTNLFIDKSNIYAASQDAVIISQSMVDDNTSPFYYGNTTVDITKLRLERYILAGLASIQGVMGPTVRFSQEHSRLVHNYLWSFGQHPFGYFGNSTEISLIFIDGIIRNTIATTIQFADNDLSQTYQMVQQFTTKYLMDSFGFDIDEVPVGLYLIDQLYHKPPTKLPLLKSMISRIHNDMEEIQKDIRSALTLSIKTTSKSEIISKLLLLTSKSSGYREYVQDELKKAESQLLCCAIRSIPNSQVQKLESTFLKTTMSVISVTAILLLVICCFVFKLKS